MAEEEVELTESSRDDYEITPLTPIRKLEVRMGQLEQAGSLPQLQSLITQIVELIRTNQKLIDSVIHADADLRNELSRIPPKIDELIIQMKNFLNMIEMAGGEEISGPSSEAMRPLTEEFKKMIEQNQKLLENNQAVLESLDSISKKLKGGTPVSQILSAYPGMRLKKEA